MQSKMRGAAVFVVLLFAFASCEEEKPKDVGEIVKARLDVSRDSMSCFSSARFWIRYIPCSSGY